MTKNIQSIRIALEKVYPWASLRIPDKEYEFPTRERLWYELITSYIDDYGYLAEITDCGDFSLFLHAWIRQQQYKAKWKKPLAFGEAWSKKHAVNIAILATEEVVLIEPQTDHLLPADTYDIIFIRM
jgi:hypothetical protein